MKKLYIYILQTFTFILFTSQAIPQNISWSHHVGGYGGDYGGFSVIDNAGNNYFSGSFSGQQCYFSTDTIEKWGANQMFIVKYNAHGVEEWVKPYGSAYSDYNQGIYGMSYSSHANQIYCIGKISSSTLGIVNFLAKLNMDGSIDWMKNYAGALPSIGGFYAICLDKNENIFVSGSVVTDVHFDTIPVARGGFIAKFDSNGKCIWAKHKFAYEPESSTDVTTHGIKVIDQNIFICGCTNKDNLTIDTITISHPGQYSSLVMCFDSSCNIKWITEGVSKNTWSYSNFDTDRDGNVYFSGGFRDTISFPGHTVITWPGIKDMFFVQYSVKNLCS